MSTSDPSSLEDRRARRAARRRAAPVRRFDDSVPSPCISVCQIDDATGCCIGCYRSMDEIRDWPIMTAEQKTAALERVADRKVEALARSSRP